MKHIIETNEMSAPLPILISGQEIMPRSWKAKLTDPESKPHFGGGFRTDIQVDQDHETEITLTFRGADSTKLREILSAPISR